MEHYPQGKPSNHNMAKGDVTRPAFWMFCAAALVFLCCTSTQAKELASRISATQELSLDRDVVGFNSNLPILVINTSGQTIQRDAKTPVNLKITALTEGRTSLGTNFDFAGRATMNIRGNTSLRYPKRSYYIKLRNETGGSLKASLLGLPKDSDWVLYAPYPDKTLMRDVLAYELSNKMGRYAPRTRFVEVFISYSGKVSLDDYMGIYVLEEKVKRAKARVDITKLDPGTSKEPDISGGYSFKKDHVDKMGGMPAPTETGMPERRGSMGMRPGFPTSSGGFPAKASGFPAARDFR